MSTLQPGRRRQGKSTSPPSKGKKLASVDLNSEVTYHKPQGSVLGQCAGDTLSTVDHLPMRKSLFCAVVIASNVCVSYKIGVSFSCL